MTGADGHFPRVTHEPAVSIPTDLRVEQIDESLADTFGDVACAGFGMPIELKPMLAGTIGRPGWNHYIAFDEDKPAAVAALYVRNDVGWLGVAATLSEYRRRGAQGALMLPRFLYKQQELSFGAVSKAWKNHLADLWIIRGLSH